MSFFNGAIFDDLGTRFKVKQGDDMSPREKLFLPSNLCLQQRPLPLMSHNFCVPSKTFSVNFGLGGGLRLSALSASCALSWCNADTC